MFFCKNICERNNTNICILNQNNVLTNKAQLNHPIHLHRFYFFVSNSTLSDYFFKSNRSYMKSQKHHMLFLLPCMAVHTSLPLSGSPCSWSAFLSNSNPDQHFPDPEPSLQALHWKRQTGSLLTDLAKQLALVLIVHQTYSSTSLEYLPPLHHTKPHVSSSL